MKLTKLKALFILAFAVAATAAANQASATSSEAPGYSSYSADYVENQGQRAANPFDDYTASASPADEIQQLEQYMKDVDALVDSIHRFANNLSRDMDRHENLYAKCEYLNSQPKNLIMQRIVNKCGAVLSGHEKTLARMAADIEQLKQKRDMALEVAKSVPQTIEVVREIQEMEQGWQESMAAQKEAEADFARVAPYHGNTL